MNDKNNGRVEGNMDRQKGGWKVEKCMDGRVDERKGERKEGCMEGWEKRKVDGKVGERMLE